MSRSSLTDVLGYWMPFEAAKAIAASFCYSIRYVLTPIFGLDFPDLCIKPDDSAYKRPSIDPDIILRCSNEAPMSRHQSRGSSFAKSTPSPRSRKIALPLTPESRGFTPTDDESDFGPGTDLEGQGPLPLVMVSKWNPVNIPRSSAPAYDTESEHHKSPTLRKAPVLGHGNLKGSARSSTRAVKPIQREKTTKGVSSSRKKVKVEQHAATTGPAHSVSSDDFMAVTALMSLRRADAHQVERASNMDRRASC